MRNITKTIERICELFEEDQLSFEEVMQAIDSEVEIWENVSLSGIKL